jgi:hypothetical protein
LRASCQSSDDQLIVVHWAFHDPFANCPLRTCFFVWALIAYFLGERWSISSIMALLWAPPPSSWDQQPISHLMKRILIL